VNKFNVGVMRAALMGAADALRSQLKNATSEELQAALLELAASEVSEDSRLGFLTRAEEAWNQVRDDVSSPILSRH
jgi:hypothetical protein